MMISGEIFELPATFESMARAAVDQLQRESREYGVLSEDGSPSLVSEICTVGSAAAGVALVQVSGLILRGDSRWYASYEALIRDLDALEVNPSVNAVVLVFDSPGGQRMGSLEACDRIAAFEKPIIGYATGHLKSAALKLALCCDQVFAAKSAEVGNIGTLISLVDASKSYEQEGLERVNVATGDFKTVGSHGAPVTEEHRGFLKAFIVAQHEHYQQVLERWGLNAQQRAAVSDGRWWTAEDAQKVGLINGVKSLREVVESVGDSVSGGELAMRPALNVSSKGATEMQQQNAGSGTEENAAASETATTESSQSGAAAPESSKGSAAQAAPAQETAPAQQSAPAASEQVPLTITALERACPGADDKFLTAQLRKGVTSVEAAKSDFIQHLQSQNAAAASEASPGGAAPVGSGEFSNDAGGGSAAGSASSGSGDVLEQFEDLVTECSKEAGGDRRLGFLAACEAEPELHGQYQAALGTMSAAQVASRRRRLQRR